MDIFLNDLINFGSKNKKLSLLQVDNKYFNDNEINKIYSKFLQISNNNKELDSKSFIKLLEIMEINLPYPIITKIFNNITNKDKNINFNDFINFIGIIYLGDIKTKGSFIFDTINQKQNNKINISELDIFFKLLIDDNTNSYQQLSKFIFNSFNKSYEDSIQKEAFIEKLASDNNILKIFDIFSQDNNFEILKFENKLYEYLNIITNLKYEYDVFTKDYLNIEINDNPKISLIIRKKFEKEIN